MSSVRALGQVTQFLMQRLALATFVIAALVLFFATMMAAFGQWSWVSLSLQYQGQPVEQAGMYAQIGLSVLALGLCFFLPSNTRIMRLENSHRQFAIGMNDVARAYATVHAADRQRNFHLSSEFDAVRERLAYLRDHPDLSTLEPAVLEVAAQMSHVSRELATIYSDDNIDRARRFLKQRQEEITSFNERLDQAKAISAEMKQWHHEVELEESVCAAQLERMRAEMDALLPELGLHHVVRTADDVLAEAEGEMMDPMQADNSVIDLTPKAAE